MARKGSNATTEAAIELRQGRRAAPYTDVPDWVGLATDAVAHSLYVRLKMHLNLKRDDGVCWPSRETLAEMLGLPDADDVTAPVARLAEIGAIDVMTEGMPARRYFVVHDLPPDGYTGPRKLKEWYALNRPTIEARAQRGKAKRDRSRARAKAHTAGEVCGILCCPRDACRDAMHDAGGVCGVVTCVRPECRESAPRKGKKAQVAPDTPNKGYQGDGAADSDQDRSPDTPNKGYQDTAYMGSHDTPVMGSHGTPQAGDHDTPYMGVEQHTSTYVVVPVDEPEQIRTGTTGGTLPPDPLRNPVPPTSARGTEQLDLLDVDPDVPPQALNGDSRPRAREQVEPEPDAEPDSSDLGEGVLPRSEAIAAARRAAAPRARRETVGASPDPWGSFTPAGAVTGS